MYLTVAGALRGLLTGALATPKGEPMLAFDFVAMMDDGAEIKASSDARDVRRWEAEYKTSVVGNKMSLTFLTQVAFIAMRRSKVIDATYPTYDIFDEHCIHLEMVRIGSGDEGELVGNPTPSEATDAFSATSPSD